jgi:two-component system sensor histidine kinase DesK
MTSSAEENPDRTTVRHSVEDSGALIAPTLARAIVAIVFCGFGGIAVLWVVEEGKSTDITLAVACLAGLLALQYFYFCRPDTDLRSRQAYGMLVAQACLAYLPLFLFGQAWNSQPAFLAGSVLLVLPLPAAWPVYVGIVASTGLVRSFFPGTWVDVAYLVVNTATAGLFVYGLTRLARLVTALHEARDELAKSTVAHERLRFARDLHDLLGLSLSAITLKSELAYRLILLDPDRARTELTEVLEISRHALADVRSVASGYHEMSLEEEYRTAESLLTTAGLNVLMDVDYGDLPAEVSTVLATVLREGVTNVLRHSKGECCEITIRADVDDAYLDVVNDGVTKPSEDRDRNGWGSGIRNMSDRVASLGGLLTAQYEDDGRFALCARIPTMRG